jgi:hypothetical protein
MLTIDPTTLVVVAALISASSALIGVLITSYFNLRTTRLSKESEERKHQKEIVINAAIENWKQTAALAQRSGLSIRLEPLDSFLVHMVALSNVIFDPTTNAENLKSRMSEVRKMTDVAEEASIEPRRITK